MPEMSGIDLAVEITDACPKCKVLLFQVRRLPQISSALPVMPKLPPDRKRAHAVRMLKRAEQRSKQAQKLVDKWKFRIAELERQGVEAKQISLWSDDRVVEVLVDWSCPTHACPYPTETLSRSYGSLSPRHGVRPLWLSTLD
jgi:hypothetical protein